MHENLFRTTCGLFALVLGCAIIVPLRAGAAQPAAEKRPVWTAVEAEMAREVAEKVPLKDIINSSVNTGAAIRDVVAGAVKIGVDPSLVVFTAINEAYDAQTVVKAALDAGVPLEVVLKSAVHAGELNKKSVYVLKIVAATVKIGADPSLVVRTAISEGYPVQTVITTALKAGAPLDVVVKSAVDAGADKKSIYAGAAEAGKSPVAVERALSAAGASIGTTGKPPEVSAEKRGISPSTPPEVAPTSRSLEPPPAIFGMGGVVLTRLPSLSQTPQLPEFGPLKINPFLGLSEAFSDNVYFTADNRKRDLITTITPGVRMNLPFDTHNAGLEYYSVITRYGYKYRSEDISDHHVNAAVDFNFGDLFGLQLFDQFARDHEPRSSSATGNNEVFHTNAAGLSAAYRTSDLTRIQIDYTKSNWGYVTDHFRDRDEDLIAGTVFYQVFAGTSAFIEYGHRKFDYTEEGVDLDSKADTVQAGLAWDISVRTRGALKAGFTRKNFTSSNRKDVTVNVWSADVRHDFTGDTTVVLTARRSLNEPNRPGIDYFTSTGGYAELTQRVNEDWAAVLLGAYVTDDFTAAKVDRTFLGGAGMTYKANDWLDFAVDYNWHQRNSSLLDKYVEHSTIITANISL